METPQVSQKGTRLTEPITACPNILAVVVTYRPCASELRALVSALLPQVTSVLVLDNTPANDDSAFAATEDFCETNAFRFLRFGTNLGIGAALNVGIRAAIGDGFDYVLLCDQDSLPASDMVAQLLAVAKELQTTAAHVGCVSPAYVDRNTGHSFGFQVQEPNRLFYSTLAGDAADPYAEVVTCITSGSLHPCRTFADVGFMREDWFIDYVDTEWCHRARQKGYHLFGTSRAKLGHSLGDRTFRIWYGHWRNYNGYSPQRLYYRFRNFVLLLRLNYVPWRWKVRACWYWLGNVYAYLVFSPDRWRNVRFVSRGLWDGFRGRTGRII